MNHAKVLVLVGDHGGCELWRTFLPVSELQRQGYEGIEWGDRDDGRLAAIVHKFDAVVLQRLHWPKVEWGKQDKWFSALHRAGLTIIYEADDDLFSDGFVKRLVDSHGYDREVAEERRDCIIRTLKMCDGATASTQRVATLMRQWTEKPIKVVENYIDLRWWRRVQSAGKRVIKGLTVGWAGGNRPDSDVEAMAEAWARVAEKRQDVTFVVQGHHAPAIYDRVPHDRIAAIEWMPIETYPAGIKNIDIGCCPLSDTPFNRAKSTIKAMEYAATGAAVAASPTLYGRMIEDNKDGFICATAGDWERDLLVLIDNPVVRESLSRRLGTKVTREYTLERNAWRWLVAWTSIVETKSPWFRLAKAGLEVPRHANA